MHHRSVNNEWGGRVAAARLLLRHSQGGISASMNIPQRILLGLATVVAVGCARTSMTSMPAPEIQGRSFRAILVIAQVQDLGLKIAMERRFMEGIVPPRSTPIPGVRFVPSHTILFPGRDYTGDQIVELMRQNGIDATLVITAGETGTVETFMPPTYTTRCTAFSWSGGCGQITTTPSGGGSYSKPWARFSTKLYDAANGQVDWVATAFSGGNAFAQTEDLVRSMADKTLERLYADRVVRAECAPLLNTLADSSALSALQNRVSVLRDSIAMVQTISSSRVHYEPVPAGATASVRAYFDSLNVGVRREQARWQQSLSRLNATLDSTQEAIAQKHAVLARAAETNRGIEQYCGRPPR